MEKDDMAEIATLLQKAEILASTGRISNTKRAYLAAIHSEPSPLPQISYGCYLLRIDCYDEAIEQFLQLMEITTGNRLRASVCNNLAVAYRESGNFEQAARWQQQSISAETQAKSIDSEQPELACDLSNLANDALMAGNYNLAENLLRRSLSLEIAQGSQEGQASDYGSLGVLALLQGNNSQALRLFWRAYRLHCRMGDSRGAGRDLLNLSHLSTQLRKHRTTVRFLNRAIRRFERACAFQLAAQARQQHDEARLISEITERDPLLN